jgi:hypothetical protein
LEGDSSEQCAAGRREDGQSFIATKLQDAAMVLSKDLFTERGKAIGQASGRLIPLLDCEAGIAPDIGY